jgi:hypothetical protein
MGVTWMWGWELGTTLVTYETTGWTDSNVFGTLEQANTTNTFQPAAGYGGGRFCLRCGVQDGNGTGFMNTPITGQNATGTMQRFIFHTAFKRVGNTGEFAGGAPQNGALIKFFSGTTEVIRLAQTSQVTAVSAMSLYINSVLVGTTTTTYTGTQAYHRIVMDMDGSTGDYDVYINGILEISVTGSAQTFVSVNNVRFLSGSGQAGAGQGGFHDHHVLWNGGNNATGSLVVATNPLNNETVTIGTQVYTFKTTLTPAANEVLIGGTAALSRRNLIHAINLGPGSGTLYGAATTLNANVTAYETTSTTSVLAGAKIIGTGPNAVATTDTLSAGGDGWGAATLTGGDSNPANDLALALGDIFIQSLQPNADVTDGAWLNVNGPNDGTNTDLFNNIDDGSALTDFIETTTSPDEYEVGHEERADINVAWAPSEVHYIQTIQIARASGAISSGRTEVTVPTIGKVVFDSSPLLAAGVMVNDLTKWRGNITTDVDGLESGFLV